MTRHHVFDPHIDTAKRWLAEVSAEVHLSPSDASRALHALRAGLHAIRDRLPANEVLDLGAQLPTLIRGFFLEGWTLRTDPRQIRDRAGMIASVKRRLGPDPQLDPVDVLRAVIRLIVQHVSTGEVDDMIATLPRPIRELWHELAGQSSRPLPHLGREPLTRRTGYSR